MKKNKRGDNIKIGIHLHLYYLDQWKFFEKQLSYLKDYDTRLIITTSKTNREKVFNLTYDYCCAVHGLENRGYDVAPFIFALNKLKKWKPDVVLKLQTKGHKRSKKKLNHNGLIYKNALEWRTRQVKGLLGSKRRVNKIIRKFDNESTGIIGGYEFLHPFFKTNRSNFKKFTKLCNFKNNHQSFFSGTMFWLRWEVCTFLIKKLKFKNFDFVDLSNAGTKNACNTLAHAFERDINSIVDYLGFQIRILDDNLQKRLFVIWRKWNPNVIFYKFIKFLYKKKITNSGKLLIKVCKIPIFSKTIKKDKSLKLTEVIKNFFSMDDIDETDLSY